MILALTKANEINLQKWGITGRQRANRGTVYLAYQPCHILKQDIRHLSRKKDDEKLPSHSHT